MSDTFDHEADAWCSRDYDEEDEVGGRTWARRSAIVRCNRCRSMGVWWSETDKGWVLMEGSKVHSCPVDLGDFPSA